MPDTIRVFRILMYEGDRRWVEAVIATSIHGTKEVKSQDYGKCYIKAATIGTYPEILEGDKV